MKLSKADGPHSMPHQRGRTLKLGLALVGLYLIGALSSNAQTAPDANPRVDIYGFAMLDMGYQFKSNDPAWFDTVRPVKLPAFADQFGKDGNFYSGVRQSRLGAKGFIPTSNGEIKTIFEFELFGTGADAGKTTFRLRHAWGEYKQVGAGQYWSNFSDPDVFPNSIEYWGPNGLVWYRNVQLRWTPWSKGDSNFAVALERPGASADQGLYADRIQLQNVKARFPWPDISAHYKIGGDWGHVQVAGIWRKIKWDDTVKDQTNLDGSANGWGINLTSNLKVKKDTIHLSAVYGEGIENYMNDAPADIGPKTNFSNPTTPIVGDSLPVLGLMAFLDHTWSDKFTTSVGYSRVDITNSDAQTADAFKVGQYALGNVMYYPAKQVMLGPEFQWGGRENNSDGFTSSDYRIQFSFKYNFSASIGGK